MFLRHVRMFVAGLAAVAAVCLAPARSEAGIQVLVEELNAGGTETLNAKNVVIAVGAQTRLLPNTKVSKRVKTYLEFITDDKLPKSVIIAGAGAIGVEFGYIMHNYGVDVTIVEFLPSMVPLEDEEISRELEKQYVRLGVKRENTAGSVVLTCAPCVRSSPRK